LHADLGHLLVNSANLLVVIWIVLQFLSLGRATFVYATSNLTAGVAAALVDSSIGSSGGIFALVFAAFAIRIRHPRASASRRSGRGPLNAGVALLMLPMLAFGSIAGHVAGAVTGFALGWWLAQKEPDPSPGNRRAPWWLGWFGVLLLFGPWVWRLLAG
jgi:membrane associated rhomboid family serine protease